MTNSEFQCTNVLIDCFFKEFVYKDLYFYVEKQKKELCDALVEFQDAYVIFQVKEKCGSTALDWLQKKVYKKAVSQIKDTIDMIKSGVEIQVESYSGERITLDVQKKILPVIIFESQEKSYRQIYTSSQNKDLRINVFSMADFSMVLERIAIPYDIISYLEMRNTIFEKEFPDLLISEINEGITAIARIENDEGLLEYFLALINGNKYIDSNAIIVFQFVIKTFQDRLLDGNLYSKEDYKEILRYLLKSNRNTVQDFMLRWQICVEHCMKKEETFQHFLIDTSSAIGYLFITETSYEEEKKYLEFILQLFKYKFELGTVIGVVFNGLDGDDYTVEWFLQSFENKYNEQFEKILKKEKPWANVKKIGLF